MDAEKALELARVAYPNNEKLRVAYMLGLNKGYEVCEEQMMKGAVEGEIVDSGFDDGTAILKAIVPDRKYDSGNKVKVIVIKED